MNEPDDFGLTKAVCAHAQEQLAQVQPALLEAVKALENKDGAGAVIQMQTILAITARLEGYFDGVQEGL